MKRGNRGARLKALPEGGKMQVIHEDLIISNADSMTLYIAAATNFVNYKDVSADPFLRVDSILGALEDCRNYIWDKLCFRS